MPQQTITIPDLIREEAVKQGIPPSMALAIGQQESGFNPTAIGPKIPSTGEQAVGTMQLTPSTAKMLGVDPNDPVQNIQGGVKYLRMLLDQHNGDLNQVFSTYGGVVHDKDYVPQVMQRMSTFEAAEPPPDSSIAATSTSSVGSSPQPQPELSLWGKIKQGMNPHELEGRRNLAGMAGATVGGAVGSLADELLGPWGTRIGSVVGAGIGGGLEDLLGEETGLAPFLAHFLPGQDSTTPTPAAEPGETALDRAWRVAKQQGEYDIGGQALMGALRIGAKPLLEGPIGKAAGRYFENQKQVALDMLNSTLDKIGASKDALMTSLGATGRQLGRDKEAALRTVGRENDAAVAAAQQAAAQHLEGARTAGQAGVDQAKAAAEAALNERRAAYDAALAKSPSAQAIPAGQAVRDVFKGPGDASRDLVGKALENVAKAGPDQDVSALGAEAQKIINQELGPPAAAFPSRVAEPEPSTIIDPTTNRPFAPSGPPRPPSALGDLSEQVAAAQQEGLIKHPAMPVLTRLLNAAQQGQKIPMEALHLMKSELSQSIQGSFGQVIKPQSTNIIQKIVGMMSKQLDEHEPYRLASDAYQNVAQLFTKGYAPIIADIARTEPEKLIQAISPDSPSAAKMLVSVLTDEAANGGGAAGKQAGDQALGAVQGAWLHRDILSGPLDTLSERVAQLRQSAPEFVQAFLGDSRAQATLKSIENQGDLFNQLVAEHAGNVKSAQAAMDIGVKSAEQEGSTAVEAARRAAEGKLDTARTAADTALEAHAQNRAATRMDISGKIRQVRADMRAARAGSPEAQAFKASTFADPRSQAERMLAHVTRGAISAEGYRLFGPIGIALGILGRLGKASDADLIKYAAYSPKLTGIVRTLYGAGAPGAGASVGQRLAAGWQRPLGNATAALLGKSVVSSHPMVGVGTPPPAPPGR